MIDLLAEERDLRTADVFAEVAGHVDHVDLPDLPGSIPNGPLAAEWLRRMLELPSAEHVTAYVETLAESGDLCWPALLVQRVAELVEGITDDNLRARVLLVGALCLGWAAAIDRRGGAT